MDNDRLRDATLGALWPLPVRSRAMFGGYGLYLDGVFFGVIAEGRLYFRTDATTRGQYLRRGMRAFQPSSRPRGPRTVDRNFEMPAEVQRDPGQLRAWAQRAAEAYVRERGESWTTAGARRTIASSRTLEASMGDKSPKNTNKTKQQKQQKKGMKPNAAAKPVQMRVKK